MSAEIACISVSRRVAITEDGQELPITWCINADGDEDCDAASAVACVAGPDKDGLYWTIDLTAFENTRLQ